MKGKVLFIIHDVYQDDNSFPLGPAYLTAMLKDEGVDVKVYCQDVFHYPTNHLENLLKSERFDLIGLGFLSARFKETVEPLCKIINQYKKDAWLVLGQHGPSAVPEYILKKTEADVVAIGEAEKTIVELIDCKVNKKDLSNVKGIAYRKEGKVYINEKRKLIMNLDSIPFPAYDFFPMDEYTTSMIYPGQKKSERSLSILTTRGCMGHCSFCYRMVKGLRRRSMDSIIKEMKFLISKYNISYFMIADELTFFNKNRVFEFEDALKKNRLKIKYLCDIRADFADEEIIRSLKRSGCQLVNIGFESMEQKVLDRMNKGTTVEDNIRTVEVCNKVGLMMGLNVMWASPCDTEESLWKLVDFIKKYNTYGEVRTIRPVTPYPGSSLYYHAVKIGLLKNADDFFKKFKNSDLITVNFTDIPTEICHKLLFKANTELILDHFSKIGGDIKEAKDLIDSFYRLYFENDYRFRGARHYDSEV